MEFIEKITLNDLNEELTIQGNISNEENLFCLSILGYFDENEHIYYIQEMQLPNVLPNLELLKNYFYSFVDFLKNEDNKTSLYGLVDIIKKDSLLEKRSKEIMMNSFKVLVIRHKDVFLNNKYFDSDWYLEYFQDMEDAHPDFRNKQEEYLRKELDNNPNFNIFYNPYALIEDYDNVVKNFTTEEKDFFKEYLKMFV